MTVNYSKAPDHLLCLNWLELEKDQAWLVFADLEKMVGKLDKKLTERRVHDVRVTLRRWYSVWDILAVDGWENSGYPDGGFQETIGRHLIKLSKSLGQLRDLDVSLALARDLHLNQIVVKQLSRERKKLKKKVEKKIGKLRLEKLIGRLRSYLTTKSNEINYADKSAL